MAIVHLLVEGEIDEAVGRRIVAEAGHSIGNCYGKKGYGYIKDKVQGFNQTAKSVNYLTLVDFADTRCNCPGEVVTTLTPNRNKGMILRVVVPEIESWLLADRKSISVFLGVSETRIPQNPENEKDPKQLLVNIARKSRYSIVRNSLVPPQSSTAIVGPLYNAELIKFVAASWDITAARASSPSLEKCVSCVAKV